MSYRVGQIAPESKLSHECSLEMLAQVISQQEILEVLAVQQAFEQRERRLNMVSTITTLLAMSLYPEQSLQEVLKTVMHTPQMMWPQQQEHDAVVPGKTALAYRRKQLGGKPLQVLFHRIARPLATPQTPGAFAFGYRLMAIDSTLEAVPDTPANAKVFGRLNSGKGACAFPLVRGVYLQECGTHAIVDAGFWPCRPNERLGATRLLRSVTPEMLLLLDSGFHGYPFQQAVHATGAKLLSRLPSEDQPEIIEELEDGSVLAWLRPSDKRLRKQAAPMLVRIISYTFTDPTWPGSGQTHRLLTTLLDPVEAPAHQLIEIYHERWEIEITIDEIDTHQRLLPRTLRSHTPMGVIQELFGCLLVHYAVRALMLQAASQEEGLDVDRLSFPHALCVLKRYLPDFQRAVREDQPDLHRRMQRELRENRLPQRRLRSNPRVIKRRSSKFDTKRPEHLNPPQPKKGTTFRDLILLI
jgi:Insertion element 4 transposase N-terminal/Transposase DDE domain